MRAKDQRWGYQPLFVGGEALETLVAGCMAENWEGPLVGREGDAPVSLAGRMGRAVLEGVGHPGDEEGSL